MTSSQAYLIYMVAAVGITAALARTLYRNGAVFLRDVFPGKLEVAEAVNHLLVTGFYMLNLGYAFFIMKASGGRSGFDTFQFLVNRLALLLLTLAAIHFVNVFVFWKIRAHHLARQLPTPTVAPSRRPGPAQPEGL